MKFETLKTGKFATKKQIIIGCTAVVVVLVATLTFFHSFAKYQVTQDLKLAEGTVNYKVPDLNMVAVYQGEGNSDTDYTAVNTVPTSGYSLNGTRSHCTVGGTKDTSIGITYSGGKVTISNLTTKGTKCYLYFDTIKDTTKPTISNVATTVTKTEINVTVTASDNVGVTEYWYQIGSNTPVKGTGNTYKFTGLTAGTTYSVKVYVKDAAGNQSDTTTKSVTTTPNGQTSSSIIAGITVKTGTPTFTNVATTDEGVYSVSDPVYGGTSYYWRGAVTNNYVKFADKCWRIVRINGDGSMRLIYDGTTCHANGSNADSIAKTSIAYNSSYNQSYYVGWTYSSAQRPSTANPQTSGTASNAKTQLESWYNSNITGTNASKVADGKYCNDRTSITSSGGNYTWAATGSTFYYGAYHRINTGAPTLSCPNGDIYSLKVGLITADEVMYAGGKFANNTSYYLYNGQNYWTMSPSVWNGSARVFFVNSNGYLSDDWVDSGCGLRPVINLKADTLFATGGNGTQSNPYVVS